jgi:nucleotide sugar dehydrogenase
MIIGIIGNGFVGKATQLLKCSAIDKMYIYDIIPDKCEPIGLTLDDLVECDIIFIALPTPMESDGSCHLGIIEKCLDNLRTIINPNKTSIILRSTVPPGTSDRLDVYFMPEFLTERNWKNDFIECKNWIFGCDLSDEKFQNKINLLFSTAQSESVIKHNTTHFTSRSEAEMIKYVRNCFLAVKVSFFNEIAEFAQSKGINYETVKDLSTLDDRIGSSHTNVPGVDGHKGFGGICLPKDTHSLLHEMKQIGMESYVIKSAIDRNEKVDRPEKDWNQNHGRAVI